MSKPNPFFPNVPEFGNLVFEYCFIEDDFPVLFICRNEQTLYLCVCCSIYLEQMWVISEVSVDIIIKMINQEVSVYEAFRLGGKKSCIARWSQSHPVKKYDIIPTVELSDDYLPEKDLYLDEDYAEDALAWLKTLNQ